jgi:hypothetical protein
MIYYFHYDFSLKKCFFHYDFSFKKVNFHNQHAKNTIFHCVPRPTFFACCVNRSGEFRMGFCRFGSNYDVGPISGYFEGDGFANSATGASYKNCTAC